MSGKVPLGHTAADRSPQRQYYGLMALCRGWLGVSVSGLGGTIYPFFVGWLIQPSMVSGELMPEVNRHGTCPTGGHRGGG
jgi:hypothetical protein